MFSCEPEKSINQQQKKSCKSEFKRRVFNSIFLPKFTSSNERNNNNSPKPNSKSNTSRNQPIEISSSSVTPPTSNHPINVQNNHIHNNHNHQNSYNIHHQQHHINNNNNNNNHTTNTLSKKESILQKFTDKRIADLMRDGKNKIFNNSINCSTNYSVNETKLREISQAQQQSQQQTQIMPVLKPVALRPKKSEHNPTPNSFRLSMSNNDQQWAYEPNRNSRFINRRSTIARSEYLNDNVLDMSVQEYDNKQPSILSNYQHHHTTTNHQHETMRPQLNLIKMKIHNLIENKPNFDMQKLKQHQLQQQQKFQLNSTMNNRNSNNNGCSLDPNLLMKKLNNISKNGSLVSLTSSTSSLLSSTSSLSSSTFNDNTYNLKNKYLIQEPKIDLELIENDS
jgi:hypothetical protein